MTEFAAIIPWILIGGFWVFVAWAILALLGVLREIVSELGTISRALRAESPPQVGSGSEHEVYRKRTADNTINKSPVKEHDDPVRNQRF